MKTTLLFVIFLFSFTFAIELADELIWNIISFHSFSQQKVIDNAIELWGYKVMDLGCDSVIFPKFPRSRVDNRKITKRLLKSSLHILFLKSSLISQQLNRIIESRIASLISRNWNSIKKNIISAYEAKLERISNQLTEICISKRSLNESIRSIHSYEKSILLQLLKRHTSRFPPENRFDELAIEISRSVILHISRNSGIVPKISSRNLWIICNSDAHERLKNALNGMNRTIFLKIESFFDTRFLAKNWIEAIGDNRVEILFINMPSCVDQSEIAKFLNSIAPNLRKLFLRFAWKNGIFDKISALPMLKELDCVFMNDEAKAARNFLQNLSKFPSLIQLPIFANMEHVGIKKLGASLSKTQIDSIKWHRSQIDNNRKLLKLVRVALDAGVSKLSISDFPLYDKSCVKLSKYLMNYKGQFKLRLLIVCRGSTSNEVWEELLKASNERNTLLQDTDSIR